MRIILECLLCLEEPTCPTFRYAKYIRRNMTLKWVYGFSKIWGRLNTIFLRMRKVIASFSCYKGEDLDMPFKSLFIAKFFVESGTFSSL